MQERTWLADQQDQKRCGLYHWFLQELGKGSGAQLWRVTSGTVPAQFSKADLLLSWCIICRDGGKRRCSTHRQSLCPLKNSSPSLFLHEISAHYLQMFQHICHYLWYVKKRGFVVLVDCFFSNNCNSWVFIRLLKASMSFTGYPGQSWQDTKAQIYSTFLQTWGSCLWVDHPSSLSSQEFVTDFLKWYL